MHGNVKFRIKQGENKTRPRSESYVNSRPRSWGEFQSNSTHFHKIGRPRKSTSDFTDEETQDHVTNDTTKDTTLQEDSNITVLDHKAPPIIKTNPVTTRSNQPWKLKTRPHSTISFVTPFYKPFRPAIKSPILPMTSQSLASSSSSDDVIKNTDNVIIDKDSFVVKENDVNLNLETDPQSLLFESSLEDFDSHVGANEEKPVTPVVAPGEDYSKNLSADIVNSDQLTYYNKKTSEPKCEEPRALTESPNAIFSKEKSDCRIDNQIPSPQCNNTSLVEADTFNENERKCSDESFDSALCVSEATSSTVPKIEPNFNTDSTDDSDVLSVQSTGFYSFENRRQDFPSEIEELDEIESENEEMPNPAPRKSKTVTASPKRSSYNQTMFVPASMRPNLRSSSSKSSISSLELSEDDTLNVQNGYTTLNLKDKTVPAKVKSPTDYSSLKRIKANGARNLRSSKTDSGTDSADSGYTKGEQTEPRTIHVKDYITPLQTKTTESLKWKPGQFKQPQPNSKPPKSMNGTWPRRTHINKRQKEEEEAEELLKRFRQTSENYRNRFRNIFTDTRRRTEEAMFGLRITMAKNGYSAPCYQPKSYSHTNSSRPIAA